MSSNVQFVAHTYRNIQKYTTVIFYSMKPVNLWCGEKHFHFSIHQHFSKSISNNCFYSSISNIFPENMDNLMKWFQFIWNMLIVCIVSLLFCRWKKIRNTFRGIASLVKIVIFVSKCRAVFVGVSAELFGVCVVVCVTVWLALDFIKSSSVLAPNWR